MYAFTLRNNRITFNDPREEGLFNGTRKRIHPSETRWVVPLDYYEDWRDWFGWTHCDVPYFERGDLLVYGPPRSGARNRSWLTGKPVLFDSPYEGAEWGVLSRALNPLGKIVLVETARLVPIELCEPATTETWFQMQEGLVKI